jgi:hypothetical protein
VVLLNRPCAVVVGGELVWVLRSGVVVSDCHVVTEVDVGDRATVFVGNSRRGHWF